MRKIKCKCRECGYISSGYFGKCPNCDSWNTLEEVVEDNKINSKSTKKVSKAEKLSLVESSNSSRIRTSFDEFNRVMGGGIIKDSISIITAKPGAGKSTLLLQISNDLAKMGYKVLYASGEESETQIKSRGLRIEEEISENFYVYSDNTLDNVIEEIDDINPDLIVIDSIQTFVLKEFTNRAGSPTQVMECAYKMVDIAKNKKNPKMVFLVGQMTKDDELAGVRSLEHLVDTVLYIQSENTEELRSLISTKNRYGSTGEIGFFIMTDKGLESLDNPSEYFMTLRDENVTGSALCVIKEGTRPIILEVEALASNSFLPYPSRISESISKDNLNTLISILEQRADIRLNEKNIVVKSAGGMKLKEPSSNLAIIMAIYSSAKKIPIPTDTVFIGDVGLTGEIKNVPSLLSRLKEIDRMGFKKVFIPRVSIDEREFKNIKLIKVKNILEVMNNLD